MVNWISPNSTCTPLKHLNSWHRTRRRGNMTTANSCWKRAVSNFVNEECAYIDSKRQLLRIKIGIITTHPSRKPYVSVLQLNCNKSQAALEYILRWGKDETHPPDILHILEPPYNHCKQTIKCSHPLAKVFHFEDNS